MALFRAKYYKKKLRYYGTATPLTQRAYNLAATTIGDYALFGGGYYDSSYSRTVNAYSSSLVQSVPDGLTTNVTAQGWGYLSATTVGDYALFGGGDGQSSTSKDVVVAYNTSLVRSFPTALTLARARLGATTVGNYALFGGGSYWSYQLVSSDVVDAYSSTLTRSAPTVLSIDRYALAATTVGNYALFGGGVRYDSVHSTRINEDTVDAYNTSLTRSAVTSLSQARMDLAATTIGDYALFGGGSHWSTYNYPHYNTVDAYDTSLTRTVISPLSTARGQLAATTLENYALFGGGVSYYLNTQYYATVDVYDIGLTRTTAPSLSYERRGLAATTVGNFALFGGGVGTDVSNSSKTVDVYTL